MKTKIIAVVFAALLASACSDSDGAYDVLKAAGYTDIQTGGYALFACSEDDTFATKFEAVGPSGQPVSGAVCAGLLFKGATIRIR